MISFEFFVTSSALINASSAARKYDGRLGLLDHLYDLIEAGLRRFFDNDMVHSKSSFRSRLRDPNSRDGIRHRSRDHQSGAVKPLLSADLAYSVENVDADNDLSRKLHVMDRFIRLQPSITPPIRLRRQSRTWQFQACRMISQSAVRSGL